jgi:uncharacterized membrane protein YjjP (DUF1212 family)
MSIASRLETDPAIDLVLRMARALHAYGTPAHRLEEVLSLLSSRLGLRGQFFSTPTSLFAAFGEGASQRTFLLRVEPGEMNLEKLALMDGILGRVNRGELALEAAAEQVGRVIEAPARYGAGLSALCFALASAAASRFFGGGWREIVVSGAIGLLIGLLALLLGRRPNALRLFEPLAATAASAAAVVAAWLLPPVSVYVVTLAGLIVLVPGLTLTVGMSELAARSLVSGTARLASAMAVFLMIAFGVALGQRVGHLLPGGPPALGLVPVALPAWTELAALALAPLGFTVLFQARPRDAGWIVGAGVLAFLGARLGARTLGPELGAGAGALLVGLACNLYARLMDRPASVPLVPGIMLLVPGSLGFRSLSALLAQDVVSGIETAFRMTLVAAGLVTGLLLANVAVPPRRPL